MGPAASVCSTANDMALWLNFVLSGGETSNGDQLIESADMDRVWQAESALPYPDTFVKPMYPVSDCEPIVRSGLQ